MITGRLVGLLLLLATCDLVASSSLLWSNATLASFRESSNTSLRYTQDNLEERLEEHLQRRWYSIYTRVPATQDRGIGWGSRKWAYGVPGVRSTTKKEKCNRGVVEYCFVDEASLNSLSGLMQDALLVWSDVTPSPDTTLTVTPFRAHGQIHGVCRVWMPPWVLRIQDCTAQDCQFEASIGMRPAQNFINVNTNKFNQWYEEGPQRRAAVVLEFARKWGNVFGLRGEHHRPDAAEYVDFNCIYMQPWELADERLNSIFHDNKDPRRYLSTTWPPNNDPQRQFWFARRIRFICENQNPDLTKLYFPEVLDFVPDAQTNLESQQEAFDYDSIMIAASYLGSMNKWQHPAISRRLVDGNPPQPWTNDPAFWIFPGGGEDPANARPSLIDVERLKYLYRRGQRDE